MSFVILEKSVYDYILRWQAPLSGLLGLFPVGSQFLVFHGDSHPNSVGFPYGVSLQFSLDVVVI